MGDFTTATIVGVGLIGGSLGMAFKRKVPNLKIFGIDDDEILIEAKEIKAIDKGFTRDQMPTCLNQSDLVFVCTPINMIIELLPQISKLVKPDTLVTDAGSTKSQIVHIGEKYFKDPIHFLGGHPMTGGEGHGIQHADPLLFENSVYVLTPVNHIPRPLIQKFGNLIEQIGSKVLFLTPAMHDKIAAAVSHIPQLLAITLVNWVAAHQKDSSHFLKLAAGGFRDMTRIASSPYEIWKDVIQTNQKEMLDFMDEFIGELKRTKESLKNCDLDTEFKNAARNRLSIPSDTRGFLLPHYDLSVRVEDKPGEIAEMATALAKQMINIKDIEVLKVREGDAGVIRFSFETKEARETAQKLFKSIGYESRCRE